MAFAPEPVVKRLLLRKRVNAKEKGHIVVIDIYPLAQNVECTDDDLVVSLVEGRIISAQLEWFPRLAKATREHRENYEILGTLKAYTGRKSMKILVCRDYCEAVIRIGKIFAISPWRKQSPRLKD